MRHPAKFTDTVLDHIKLVLEDNWKVLDPFAGTGKIKQIFPSAICVEIEPEWASMAKGIRGDALNLPFADETFDAIATSPVYGNRMSDHNRMIIDKSIRHTYRHSLDHDLHPHNSGTLQWGKNYREFHEVAWLECERVLKPGGFLILNVKDHIRKGELQEVTLWHKSVLVRKGLYLKQHYKVKTPSMRFGTNSHLRLDHEHVMVFQKPFDLEVENFHSVF